ncbi:MAG: arylsulfatase [candidate division KSB1 bacterium]|nr:arylsulfatase [candidate division KSB1 bacterium]
MKTRREFIRTAGMMIPLTGLSLLSCERFSKLPNILLIMADDLGYSDPGCYGSFIDTPHLDNLAKNGIRFTQFYNTSRGCPTRASLFTGFYAHQTGLGWMPAADLGHPGYTGRLNDKKTLAEMLKQAGYSTFMSGKWHLCSEDNAHADGDMKNWPMQRGFERFFGTLGGGGSYFDPPSLMWHNSRARINRNFYFTDSISDAARLFLGEHFEKNANPFFMVVAYTAPHWPLHAKKADIQKYRGRFLQGWDRLRESRYKKMLDQDILSQDCTFLPGIQNWKDLSDQEKDDMDKRMSVYAAQIDCMDQGIGRILDTLREHSALDNTLILFTCDNGASDEQISRRSDRTDLIGTRISFESYGKSWAHCSNTPFRGYKGQTYEGGIAAPLIAHWPEQIGDPGRICRQIAHVIDIVPTCLQAAGMADLIFGNKAGYLQGISVLPWIQETTAPTSRTLFWEHRANRAVRDGDWKLISHAQTDPPYTGEWELYNMRTDRCETQNIAAEYPQMVQSLSEKWQAWAEKNNVLPLDGRPESEKIANPMENISKP